MLYQLLLPKRSDNCSGCEQPLRAGADLTSLLREGAGELYERNDLCPKCSEGVAPPEELICVWRGKVPADVDEPKKKQIMSAKARALDLLRTSLEGEKLEAAYLLTLYLERRKVLERVKELRRKSGVIRLYKVVEGDELFAVPQIERIADQKEREQELLEALRGDD